MPELGHFVECVQGQVPDVVVAQVQGGQASQRVERVVGKSREVEGVRQAQILHGVAHLPVGSIFEERRDTVYFFDK